MQSIFRIFYSASYTALFILLIVLLAITLSDTIRQSVTQSKVQNAFIITGGYVLAAILALFIYASRIYNKRTVLASIPKFYLPIQAEDVRRKVRQLIAKDLDRSTLISWHAEPRSLTNAKFTNGHDEKRTQGLFSGDNEDEEDEEGDDDEGQERAKEKLYEDFLQAEKLPALNSQLPPWGFIHHPGWSSPDNEQFKEVQFSKVIPELPNLIEAKAVSLAESGLMTPAEDGYPTVAALASAVATLRRPAEMDLRQYLDKLSSLALVDASVAASFLGQYEYARFAHSHLSEADFEALMRTFSAILSGMTRLDFGLIDALSVRSGYGDVSSVRSTDVDASSVYRLRAAPSSMSVRSMGSGSVIQRREPTSLSTTNAVGA